VDVLERLEKPRAKGRSVRSGGNDLARASRDESILSAVPSGLEIV